MRDSQDHRWNFHDAPEDAERKPSDPAAYWRSFFAATVQGPAQDHHTMGAITDVEARFHYNATQNSILRAWASLHPPARGALIGWSRRRMATLERRSLDVGAGTGHWVDFCREVLSIRTNVALELTDQMCDFLREKYAGRQGYQVVQADVTDELPDEFAGSFVVITAIGVMFHIVDDTRWRCALANLARCLAPGGLLVVGGDFGTEDRDAQFHSTDRFRTWAEERQAREAGEVYVNKRVRSLATWSDAAGGLGLEVVALERSERHPQMSTPENDILVLRRPAPQDP